MKPHPLVGAVVLALSVAGAAEHRDPQFRAQVSAVRLDVLVLEHGRPMPGLTSADFEVFDDGQRQDVSAAWAEQTPLDVVLALDRSESVEGETLVRLKEAVRATLGTLRDEDRAAMLTFAHAMSLDVPLQRDPAALSAALDRVAASGGTCVLDAVYSAISIAHGSDRRTLILLFSDGFDNRSWLTPDDVARAARESDAIIYSVAFVPPSPGRRVASLDLSPHLELLGQLSDTTGGEVLTIRRGEDLAPAFVRILETMRARYLLTYVPKGGETKGWHELRVRVKRRGAEVVVRPGYRVR